MLLLQAVQAGLKGSGGGSWPAPEQSCEVSDVLLLCCAAVGAICAACRQLGWQRVQGLIFQHPDTVGPIVCAGARGRLDLCIPIIWCPVGLIAHAVAMNTQTV